MTDKIIIEVTCEMVVLVAAAHSNNVLELVLLAFPKQIIAVASVIVDYSVRCFDFTPCLSGEVDFSNEKYGRLRREMHRCVRVRIQAWEENASGDTMKDLEARLAIRFSRMTFEQRI
ncbi:hypothetical protein ES702_03426 [subsurface metagenome]